MNEDPFTVIIAGGGPVGLTAAHALSKAGIDFILLERKENVIIDVGASIILGAESLRVMHQLGLLKKLLEKGCELQTKKSITVDGYEFKSTTYKYVKAK